MRALAFLDGSLADSEAAHLRVDDLGLLRGDGVFETILVAGKKARELRPHLDRLARSAAMLELPAPDLAGFERAARAVIDAWPEGQEIALKLVYTRGVDGDPAGTPTAFALGVEVDASIRQAREQGVSVVTLERGFGPDLAERAPWLLLGSKSISYAVNMAALREAARRGAQDVIFTATDGSVLEGPTSTVVLAKDRTLYTPPSTIGILPGTTQYALFRGAEKAGWTVKVEPIAAVDLAQAEGLFLTSSVRLVTRVHTLDGVALPDSTAVHRELTAAYDSVYSG
ncbi:4-amino-4-deoxychorismate lyase [Amycolatopsis sulphurea]|uniref:4-amino-4-deoxychorismate lyase n=1 Tax=Amycolatopsis sulphurea TaxID=76022 RepID=A0A2A9FDX3_9PSEU|nr:aminodeoxychorismate lyase [Amycolatopsis sulphurea]PFG48615.1 4-amino-4-deoxychorismate lyase [Amycolatopsis sulphurea]